MAANPPITASSTRMDRHEFNRMDFLVFSIAATRDLVLSTLSSNPTCAWSIAAFRCPTAVERCFTESFKPLESSASSSVRASCCCPCFSSWAVVAADTLIGLNCLSRVVRPDRGGAPGSAVAVAVLVVPVLVVAGSAVVVGVRLAYCPSSLTASSAPPDALIGRRRSHSARTLLS